MNEDALNPESTPSGLNRSPRVKKMTNMPIFIIVGIASIFCILLIYVVNKKSEVNQAQLASNPDTITVDSSHVQKANNIAEEINALYPDNPNSGNRGNKDTNAVNDSITLLGRSVASTEPAAPRKPEEPNQELLDEISTLKEELEQLKAKQFIQEIEQQKLANQLTPEELERQRKRQKILDDIRNEKFNRFKQSVVADTAVSNNAPVDAKTLAAIGSEVDSIRAQGDANINRQLGQIENAGALTGGNRQPSAFPNTGLLQSASYDLGKQREAGNRYQLRTGTVIPAVLTTGIKSDISGTVMARVSQNVYDTATGRYLVIPQGTGLYGTYNNAVAIGQTRSLVRWDRLIFPDGSSLDLLGMPGSDREGYTGFRDKVNNHYFKVFGSAFLLSLFSTTVTASLPDSDDNDFADELALSVAQQFNETASQIIERNLDIKPTLTTRSGYKFNILVNKDIDFSGHYEPMPLQ